MRKYVIKFSASGALCFTQIGCGVSQDHDKHPVPNQNLSAEIEESLQKCTADDTDVSVEDFLASLDKQGRIDCDKFFSEERDLNNQNVIPGQTK